MQHRTMPGPKAAVEPEDKRRPCSKCLVYIHPCAIRNARRAVHFAWRLVRCCKSSAIRQLCNSPLSLFSATLARTPRQSGRGRHAELPPSPQFGRPSLVRARGSPAIEPFQKPATPNPPRSALRLASLRCRPPAHPARRRHNSRINLDAGSLTTRTTVTRLPALCQPSAGTTTLTPAPTSPTACSRARR